jgi:ubiquinone/menaquinone biosynthesis C-methylase UbiE
VFADMLELPRRITAALVADAGIEVQHVVDVGAGPGTYLAVLLDTFPQARGTWFDVSEAMLELGRTELARFGERISYVVDDAERLGEAGLAPAQIVSSSRALHHVSTESLARVYRAAFGLLSPGGFLANLDHVGVPGDFQQAYRRVRPQFTGTRTSTLAPHRHDYPLAPPDLHLRLLAEAGFEAPDTPWRVLFTALILARKPL